MFVSMSIALRGESGEVIMIKEVQHFCADVVRV